MIQSRDDFSLHVDDLLARAASYSFRFQAGVSFVVMDLSHYHVVKVIRDHESLINELLVQGAAVVLLDSRRHTWLKLLLHIVFEVLHLLVEALLVFDGHELKWVFLLVGQLGPSLSHRLKHLASQQLRVLLADDGSEFLAEKDVRRLGLFRFLGLGVAVTDYFVVEFVVVGGAHAEEERTVVLALLSLEVGILDAGVLILSRRDEELAVLSFLNHLIWGQRQVKVLGPARLATFMEIGILKSALIAQKFSRLLNLDFRSVGSSTERRGSFLYFLIGLGGHVIQTVFRADGTDGVPDALNFIVESPLLIEISYLVVVSLVFEILAVLFIHSLPCSSNFLHDLQRAHL